jgi:hypothetical protein
VSKLKGGEGAKTVAMILAGLRDFLRVNGLTSRGLATREKVHLCISWCLYLAVFFSQPLVFYSFGTVVVVGMISGSALVTITRLYLFASASIAAPIHSTPTLSGTYLGFCLPIRTRWRNGSIDEI